MQIMSPLLPQKLSELQPVMLLHVKMACESYILKQVFMYDIRVKIKVSFQYQFYYVTAPSPHKLL